MASPPCCTTLEAPLKAVVMIRLKSPCTWKRGREGEREGGREGGEGGEGW
jgi:hypothetical protein